MANAVTLPRSLWIYGLCLPLALLIGYLLATPLSFSSMSVVGLIVLALFVPIILRWHHALLIVTWNAYFVVFFLPGEPSLGIVVACVSLFLVLLDRFMHKDHGYLHVPTVALPLLFLALAVLVTAKLSSGIGGRALGAETWGAKRYLSVFGAIIGYFAMVSRSVPEERAQLYASLFVLSGVSAVVSDVAYAAGPGFYFLFTLFPANLALSQAVSQDMMMRLSGVCFAAVSAYHFMLLRYGIRGICDLTRPWRLVSFLSLVVLSTFGGYRSAILLGVLIVFVQFFLEGLHKTRFLLPCILGGILSGALLIPLAEKLPLSVQRSLSFLPLDVNPAARYDAQYTLEWRFEIWRIVTPEIPKYFWLGKGFGYSGTDYYLAQESIKRGLHLPHEDTLISGNYHQGVLTLVIPFGVWGLIGFGAFGIASLRVLYSNYRYGRDSLKLVNTFLLAHFVARLIYYLFFHGQFDSDLVLFTGLVGLSIALNGGVKTAKTGNAGETGGPAPEIPAAAAGTVS